MEKQRIRVGFGVKATRLSPSRPQNLLHDELVPIPSEATRGLLMHPALCAFCLAREITGSSNAAMMPMTTSNSIKVNPLHHSESKKMSPLLSEPRPTGFPPSSTRSVPRL